MYNLFDQQNSSTILERIEKLNPDSKRQWGRMDVAKMLAHCSAALEMSMTETKFPRSFMGFVFGKMAKSTLTNQEPFKQNLPTDKRFLVANPDDFEKEKQKLVVLIKRFNEGGHAVVSKFPHPFFGKLKAEEWATGMHKHLDHHLKQFGV